MQFLEATQHLKKGKKKSSILESDHFVLDAPVISDTLADLSLFYYNTASYWISLLIVF